MLLNEPKNSKSPLTVAAHSIQRGAAPQSRPRAACFCAMFCTSKDETGKESAPLEPATELDGSGAPMAWNDKMRLCAFYGSSLSTRDAVMVADQEINYEMLLTNGCSMQCLLAANITPGELVKRGVDSPQKFKRLGLDALDLLDSSLTQDFIRLFGATAMRSAFVTSSQDVIALAGSRSSTFLRLTVDESLALCAGDPVAAQEYLSALGDRPCALRETSVRRLLDCGIRAGALTSLGIRGSTLLENLNPPPTPDQMTALGFEFRL